MKINKDKIKLFLPNKRLEHLNTETFKKIEFFQNREDIVFPVYMMPDLSGDGIILSGININRQNGFYPLSAGADIGCGYRVLHSPLTKSDLSFLEKDLKNFSKKFTEKEITTEEMFLFELFWNKNYEELEDFMEYKYHIHSFITEPRNLDKPHNLSKEAFFDAWGNIAVGNHFVELREIVEIRNDEVANDLQLHQNEILFHIHSGAGKKIEHEFILYWAKCVQQFKNNNSIKEDGNGYEVFLPIDMKLAQEFLDDSIDSINYSMFNRSLISSKLQQIFDCKLIDLFDSFHDGYQVNGQKVTSQKGVQSFKNVNGHEIAIIPGSLNTNSYIVKRKGDIPFINHGTGEGVQGIMPDYENVLTNLENPILRKYHDIQATIEYGEDVGLFEVIAELKPWICIKKEVK